MYKSLILPLAFACAFTATSFAANDIIPTRVGPVSQYGKLIVGKNTNGQGRIYGDCEGVKNGAEVQVRGMSLYWSLMDEALEFWTEDGIKSMISTMKIQIVRAAMATGTEDWTKGKYIGYQTQPDKQKQFVKDVVEAAIRQDIYVIIDWHSHEANTQTESAKGFFKEMAEEYGKYDNVIFELFNEPKKISWDDVKNYANQVISVIREYSDNLILVGNPEWDQNPQQAIGNEVNDPKKNTAYTFHYYAGMHNTSGEDIWGNPSEGKRAQQAIDAGLSLFVSEWGTVNSDGKGGVSDKNDTWQDFINQNQLSWANWSASRINEGASAFTTSSNAQNISLTASGQKVANYLSSNPTSYTACATRAVPATQQKLGFMLDFDGKNIHFVTEKNGLVNIEIFDLLGHSQFQQTKFFIKGAHQVEMKKLPKGTYLVRLDGENKFAKTKIQIK